MDHSSTGPLFTRFPNQEYCNGLPCPPPGDLPHSRIEPRSPKSPALQEDPLLLSHGGSPFIFFSWAQLPSRVQLFVIPWTVVRWVSFSITNSRSLLKLTSIKSAMPSNHLILCCPSSPAFNLAQYQGIFQWVSSSHQVAKVLELQLQHQSFQWIFRTDFL